MGNWWENTSTGKRTPFFKGISELPSKLINEGMQAIAAGMQFRFGGLLTYEKPIVEIEGDIVIGVGETRLLMAGSELPRNCVGVRFIRLIDNVQVSFNGKPPRTVLNNDSYFGCEIRSLQVFCDATGTCIIQPVGTGD